MGAEVEYMQLYMLWLELPAEAGRRADRLLLAVAAPADVDVTVAAAKEGASIILPRAARARARPPLLLPAVVTVAMASIGAIMTSCADWMHYEAKGVLVRYEYAGSSQSLPSWWSSTMAVVRVVRSSSAA